MNSLKYARQQAGVIIAGNGAAITTIKVRITDSANGDFIMVNNNPMSGPNARVAAIRFAAQMMEQAFAAYDKAEAAKRKAG